MAVALLHTLPVLSPRMRLQCILITLSSVTCISLVRESAVRLNTEDFPFGKSMKSVVGNLECRFPVSEFLLHQACLRVSE